MQERDKEIVGLAGALKRARFAILTIAFTYALAILTGLAMVHGGNRFALDYRDKIVGNAGRQDAAAEANIQGDRMKAAALDFAGNLIIGSVPKALMGIGVVFPYPFVAYQGWIGGIVSVRNDHTSRLGDFRSATYYLLTLLLQIAGYSIAVGAGVNIGLSMFRLRTDVQSRKWARIFPVQALRDFGWLYLIAVPIFLAGSLWEFLSTWNL